VLAAIPVVGFVELVLHVKQTTSDVVPESDWDAARDAVKGEIGPDDVVIFAPFWADPIGREHFGDALAGVRHEGRPDDTRFARAFEVSIRGAHLPELAGWKKLSEKNVGKITIGVYENPSFTKPKVDLIDLMTPDRAQVFRVDANGAEQPCAFNRGQGAPGGLGVPQGPAVPGEKFMCPGGGWVGVAVLHDVDHHPHTCIFPAGAGPGSLRIKFLGVTFAEGIHGHAGVQWVDARADSGAPVSLAFSAFGRPIEKSGHRTGTGWTYFELPTPELTGKKGDLVVDVAASQPHYCFEADIR
jgi:hypothetical protein